MEYSKEQSFVFWKSVIHSILSRFGVIIFGTLSTILITRAMLPEERGVYALLSSSLMLLSQFGILGLHTAHTYQLSKNKCHLPHVVSNSIFVTLFFTILFVIVLFLFHELLEQLFGLDQSSLWLLVIFSPFALLGVLLGNAFLGLHQPAYYNYGELMRTILFLLSTGILFVIGETLASTYFLFLGISWLACSLFFLVYLKCNSFSDYAALMFSPSYSFFRDNISYALKSYMSCIFFFLLNRISFYFIDHLLGKETLGYYSVAFSLIEMFVMIPTVTSMLLLPRLSQQTEAKDKWLQTQRILFIYFGFLSVTGGISIFISPWLFVFLFGQNFAAAAEIYNLFVPMAVILGLITAFSSYISSIGMRKVIILAPFTGLLTFLGGVWLWPFAYDIYSFVIIQTIAYSLYLLVFLVDFIRNKPIMVVSSS